MTQDLVVPEGAASERLDVFLATSLGLSRSRCRRLIDAAHVAVNGNLERASYLVQPGDLIYVAQPELETPTVEPPDLPVIYEDADVLVVDKPAGLAMHPGAGRREATVADFARLHTTDTDPERPGIVHRLDRDTSGLVVLAKTAAAKAYMQRQFAARAVHKTYVALVTGHLNPSEAIITLPLDRNPAHPTRRTATPGGRDAVTAYRTLTGYRGFSLVEAKPRTGRTHQLRVHFATLGHPVAGDITYGPPKRPLGLHRQFLHATALQFTTPSGQTVSLASPLPPDLEDVLNRLAEQV